MKTLNKEKSKGAMKSICNIMRVQRKELLLIGEWKTLPKGDGIWGSKEIWNIFFWQAGCDSSRQNNLACVISSQEELPERNGCTHQSFLSLLLYGSVQSFSAVLPFSVQGFVLKSQCVHLACRHPLVTWMEVQVCDCSLVTSQLPIVNHPQEEPHDAVDHASRVAI